MNKISDRLNVLLAEDDANDAFLVQRALDRLKLVKRLIVVQDAERVIQYLRGQAEYVDRTAWPLPDLLILDHWMPRLSGFEALSWLRTDPALVRLPVVVLSGGLTPDQTEAMNNLQAACCSKAIDLADTVRDLQTAVESAFRMVRTARSATLGAQIPARPH